MGKEQTKVLMSTGSLYHMGIDHIFNIAQQAGFKHLELMLRSRKAECWWDFWNHNYIKNLEKIHNIKVSSLHSPIDFEMDAAGYIDSTISLAQRLRVGHVIFHIPKNKDRYEEYRQWFANNYKKYMETSPVMFLTENMGPKCVEQGVNKYNEYPNFCFDTAHEISNGSDVIKMVSEMPNIRQFHLSWFDGKECHMNILKQKKFFRELISIRPDALRCLELRPEAFANPYDDQEIVNSLIQSREFLENISE
ncbi:MAG: hypothetical protein WCT32_00600 [Patescibacteria group bacterium]